MSEHDFLQFFDNFELHTSSNRQTMFHPSPSYVFEKYI